MTRFLPDGLLDMFDPSLPGRPERTLGFGSDLHAGPASHSPGRGLVRLDTAGPFRSLGSGRRRCRRRAIGRGMMGPTPK